MCAGVLLLHCCCALWSQKTCAPTAHSGHARASKEAAGVGCEQIRGRLGEDWDRESPGFRIHLQGTIESNFGDVIRASRNVQYYIKLAKKNLQE